MSTTPTSNPIPSESPRDLAFNAGKIDEFVNSPDEAFSDRFGIARLTLTGIQAEADNVIGSLGFLPVDSFEAGATISSRNQSLHYLADNNYYRWDGSLASPKVVLPGSTPTSAGGVAAGAWVNVTDNTLRGQLASETGYQLIPSIQKQRWKDAGDIRGWDAVCDGIADDIIPITNAIADTDGNIVIPKNVFVSSHIVIKDKTNPVVTVKNGATVKISTDFTFASNYRGIFVFHNCSNPKIIDPIIIGAKVDKVGFPGTDAIQDGDAGVEYAACTGLCHTIRPIISDVKTWGVIHIDCDEYHVDSPKLTNCQVQSGVGGTGVNTATITNPIIDNVGLYGIEMETVDANLKGSVIGGVITHASKAIGLVHNTDQIHVVGTQAIECGTGFSVTSGQSQLPSETSTFTSFVGCKATSCVTALESVYSNNVRFINCIDDRNNLEFFTRTRALDRIYTMTGNKGFVPEPTGDLVNLSVGDLIILDSGVQYTIASVDSSVTTDAIYGPTRGFTTTTPLPSDSLRRSFRRYRQVTTSKTGFVMYGGSDVRVTGCHFTWDTNTLVSFGNHADFVWQNNFVENSAEYFVQGSAGTVSGRVHVDVDTTINNTFGTGANKFLSCFSASRSFSFQGGTTSAQLSFNRSVYMPATWLLSGAGAVLDPGSTTTGTISLLVNDNTVISGGFTGTPVRASNTLTTGILAGPVALVRITDTVGNLISTGYSVELRGAFSR